MILEDKIIRRNVVLFDNTCTLLALIEITWYTIQLVLIKTVHDTANGGGGGTFPKEGMLGVRLFVYIGLKIHFCLYGS